MRQIKFRIWDTKTNKNVTNALTTPYNVYYPNISTIGGVYFDRMEGGELICLNDNEDCEGRFVLQDFTGLLDKNGWEIYEGDIVVWDGPHDSEWIGTVEFVAPSFEINWFKTPYPAANTRLDSRVRVVGNKFENPESLNE